MGKQHSMPMADRRDDGCLAPKSSKNLRINLTTLIVLVGFVAASSYHYVNSAYFRLGYPFTTFLCLPSIQFSDFFVYLNIIKDFNPYFTAYVHHSNYFPFMNVLNYPFIFIPTGISLFFYLSLFTFVVTYLNFRYLRNGEALETIKNTLILSFLTYPVLFLIDRTNTEGWVYIFLGVSMYRYSREKYISSALLLALAIATKGYPALFLLLFLADKRYRELLLSVGVASFATLASLLLHRGGFLKNLSFVMGGFEIDKVDLFRAASDHANNFVQRGPSLYASLKILFNTTDIFDFLMTKNFLSHYLMVIGVLVGMLSIYVVFIERSLWKKAAVVVIMMLLFPHISADYKLIHLYVPLCLFLSQDGRSARDVLYSVLFGLVLIPKNYAIIPNMVTDIGRDVSISIPMNVLLLLALLIAIVHEGLFTFLKSRERVPIKAQIKDHLSAIRSQVLRVS